MKNSISIRSAIISGFIGTSIGLAITYFYNWGQPVNQLTDVFVAIGTASFCAAFGGNIGGQMEILDRNNNN